MAKLLDVRTLVINRGNTHGVKRGMVFEIVDKNGVDIKDPDNGEVIGSVNTPKVRVKVTDVEEGLCVASTFRTVKRNVGGTGPDWTSAMLAMTKQSLPPKWVTETETLQSELDLKLDPKQSRVQIGDIARLAESDQ